MKLVSFRPSSRALSFIRATKACSEPQRCSAIATAQSFAETTQMHFSISLTLIFSPCSRYTQLPPKDAARSEAMTVSSRLISPRSIASTISSIVMTFVTLAGGSLSCEFFSYMTSPVTFSVSIADGAEISISLSVSVFIAYTGLVSKARHSAAQMSFFIAIPPLKSYACAARDIQGCAIMLYSTKNEFFRASDTPEKRIDYQGF